MLTWRELFLDRIAYRSASGDSRQPLASPEAASSNGVYSIDGAQCFEARCYTDVVTGVREYRFVEC